MLAGCYAPQLSSFPLAVCCICFVALALCRQWWLAALFALGATLFWLAALSVIGDRIEPRYEGDSILTLARVIDFPRQQNATVSLLLEAVDDPRLPGRVRASWHDPGRVPVIGETWQLELRLRRPRGSANPGGFDYETWLFRERIAATGYVVPGARNRLVAGAVGVTIETRRQVLAARVSAVIADPATAAVLTAIALGTRHLLSPEQWQRYARTGTSHLMAISGLHVGLAAVAAYYAAMLVLALLRRRGNNHDAGIVAALLVAAAYVLVSGMAVPAQRAFLMLVLGTAVALRRRQLRGPQLLAATCIIVVLVDPLATLQPGFRMSFAAVAALFWLARRRREHRLRRLLVMQLILFFGLLPLSVLMFQRAALPAPFVNLVAVPVFSVVTVPATLLGVFAGSDIALRAAGWSVAGIERLIGFVPQSGGAVAAIESSAWLFLVACALWAVLPPGWPGRHCGWLAMIAILLWRPAVPPHGCVDATFLDVGQGLAIVLQTHRATSIYDTGPAWRSGGNAAERTLIPFLANRGIDEIDKLVVSHSDLDHAGGIASLLDNVPARDILLGEGIPGLEQLSRPCVRGQSWQRDGVEFRIVHPGPERQFQGNDGSCLLRVSAGRGALLITGDIELPAEREIIRAGRLRAVDVVTVPHHGSRTSSSASFVQRLSPRYAIVAAGHGNRWGFPKEEVVARWQQSGARVLQTAASGAIGIQICSWSGVRAVREAREQGRRLWHEP